MPRHALVSRARNAEDVVLLRALGQLAPVRYARVDPDLDAGDPGTQALEAAGWTGAHRGVPAEPGVVGQAVADLAAGSDAPLHVLWVTTTYGADEVFPALAGGSGRPWIVLVERAGAAPDGLDAAAAAAGYVPGLFDGVSRYFADQEHPELFEAISYPPCSRDTFLTSREATAVERSESLLGEVIHWRRLAVTSWADAVVRPNAADVVNEATGEARRLEIELAAMRNTLSWRVTGPLRLTRRVLGRVRNR
jgi:hypothetical protein